MFPQVTHYCTLRCTNNMDTRIYLAEIETVLNVKCSKSQVAVPLRRTSSMQTRTCLVEMGAVENVKTTHTNIEGVDLYI